SWDATVKLWAFRGSLEQVPLLELSGHDSGVECLSVQGQTVASVAEDGQTLLWDLRTEDSWAEFNVVDLVDGNQSGDPVGGIAGMRWNGEHRLLFCSNGGLLWEVDTRRQGRPVWVARTSSLHQEGGPWAYTDLLGPP